MNVTVADCLKLPTLREAQLIAGAKGTDRAVSSVSVLEWPETNLLSDELIVGNELVISALVTIKDDVSRQCSVLRHLRSMGAAGLVLFYVGVFIPQIDDALIAVADEINLPLIAMPFGRMDFRYSDVITDVVEYIHNRRMHGNYYATELMNSIALLEPQQRNINTALRLLSDRLHCTLLLTNRYLDRRGSMAGFQSMGLPCSAASIAAAARANNPADDNDEAGREMLQALGCSSSVQNTSRDAPVGDGRV